jgi:hypothetical protein
MIVTAENRAPERKNDFPEIKSFNTNNSVRLGTSLTCI